jgi:hypothetical protein
MHFSRTQTLTIANNTRDISGKAFSLIKTLIEKENIALTEKIFRNGGRVHFGNSFAYEGAVDISKISKLDFSATFDEIVGKTKAGTPVVEKKIISGSLRLSVDNPTAFNALSDVQQKNLLKNMLRENRAAGVEIVTVMDAW